MLGIIGGVGPFATARLYMSLTSRFSAQALHDLPELLIHSVAMTREIEDAFVGGLVGPRSPELKVVRDMLGAAVGRLVRGGADLVVMPCNTLQGELATICTGRKIEHIDMLEATVEAIVAAEARRVLILGTTTTCRADLYGQRLSRHGVACVYPEAGEQQLVEAHIRGALDRRPGQCVSLTELVREQARSCDGVVLACTDLSSEVAGAADGPPIFDSLECLATAAIRRLTRPVELHELREWREHGS